MGFFEGFTLEQIDVAETTVRVRHGGDGPPLVLLHGHPRTHATWHRVAPLLAPHHTVVCPDLRGYGKTRLPPTREDHSQSSKRAMAADVRQLMRRLGHERFGVVGHDRGSAVAYRFALDHPEAITRLAVFDCIPIGEHLARADARFATAWWHWFFFGQTEKPAERVINADPEAWYRVTADYMGPEAFEDLSAALRDPGVVHGMLEDYRAGLTVDRDADDADRAAGAKITCPVLAGWSTRDDMEELYGDVVAVWQPWADDVRGVAIESGHHVAEEAPDKLAAALLTFFGG
ncbi:MAG TPA: alpha/beta hydrolase [Gaiellaceae bacterium]|nr:alpha/beta hydrolase [Gaiellaceae bacterium]